MSISSFRRISISTSSTELRRQFLRRLQLLGSALVFFCIVLRLLLPKYSRNDPGQDENDSQTGYPRPVVLTLALRRFGSYRLRYITGWASHPVIRATAARHPRVRAETRPMQSIQCRYTSFLHIQDRDLVSRGTARITGGGAVPIFWLAALWPSRL